LLPEIMEGRQGRGEPCVIRYGSVIQRDVVVHPDEDALSSDIQLLD